MREIMLAPLRYPLAAALGAFLAALMIVLVPVAVYTIEPILFPVNSDWKVLQAERDGSNLILRGTMMKHRNCVFLPPTIARTSDGQNLRITHGSLNRGTSWAADDEPQKWGPWIVENGAGKQISFVNAFSCHGFWPTFSDLGSFDARGL